MTVSRQPRIPPEAVDVAAGGNLSSSIQGPPDSQLPVGVAGPPSTVSSTAIRESAGDFVGLRIWAESYADAQQTRIALVNRMERGGIDSELLEGHRSLLDASENAFRLAMVRSYRRVVREAMPEVEAWQKSMFGIGEHLLARLIGHLGHPVIATPYMWSSESPEGHECIPERCGERHLIALEPFDRTLRQLWAYCGHGAPERRRKGMSQEDALGLGSPRCKMLVHLLAESTIKCRPDPKVDPKTRSLSGRADKNTPPTHRAKAIALSAGSGPESMVASIAVLPSVRDRYYYRRIYDARKAATADREWTDGHRHADALRIVGKEILRDLWQTSHAQTRSGGLSGLGEEAAT